MADAGNTSQTEAPPSRTSISPARTSGPFLPIDELTGEPDLSMSAAALRYREAISRQAKSLRRVTEATATLVEAEALFLPRTRSVSRGDALRLAHRHGCSSQDAAVAVLAKQLDCLLLACGGLLLQLFPEVAVKPGTAGAQRRRIATCTGMSGVAAYR